AAEVESQVDAGGVYALLTDRLAPEARTLLAAALTEWARAGLLVPLAGGAKPAVVVADGTPLAATLAADLGEGRVAVADVAPAAFARDPVLVLAEDLGVRIFGGPDPLTTGPAAAAEHD